MIGERRVLAVVPARGGSKGVPRKNIRRVAGRPLLAYTLDSANAARTPDLVVVSSEDEEILNLAGSFGAEPLVRPEELAADATPGVAVLLHALECHPGYDYVVLLQPTSPLRTADDIDLAVRHCMEARAPLCVSVCLADKSPWWMFTRGESGRLEPLLPGLTPSRRQDTKEVLVLNGAVYVVSTPWLMDTRNLDFRQAICTVMPAERSLDIDTEDDLRYLEYRLTFRP